MMERAELERAVLELWERLARAAESGLSDEAFRLEVLSVIEAFQELLPQMLETTVGDMVDQERCGYVH
jgi:hypothetical protein